jgi:cation channel sperm-associated protein 2
MRILDLFALVVFILEMMLRWIDNFWNYWKDPWNILDFVVTLMVLHPNLTYQSLVPEIIVAFERSGSETSSLSIIAHELRALRIIRTLKMVVRFGSLKIIILTIIQAIESMSYILLLIVIIVYIYAVIGVNLYRPFTLNPDPDNFYTDIFA